MPAVARPRDLVPILVELLAAPVAERFALRLAEPGQLRLAIDQREDMGGNAAR
jgi:hypothetical protein